MAHSRNAGGIYDSEPEGHLPHRNRLVPVFLSSRRKVAQRSTDCGKYNNLHVQSVYSVERYSCGLLTYSKAVNNLLITHSTEFITCC